MRISDWSSDVCSSDLARRRHPGRERARAALIKGVEGQIDDLADVAFAGRRFGHFPADRRAHGFGLIGGERLLQPGGARSEEHTSELQSLMRISYAVFCFKKKNKDINTNKQ